MKTEIIHFQETASKNATCCCIASADTDVSAVSQRQFLFTGTVQQTISTGQLCQHASEFLFGYQNDLTEPKHLQTRQSRKRGQKDFHPWSGSVSGTVGIVDCQKGITDKIFAKKGPEQNPTSNKGCGKDKSKYDLSLWPGIGQSGNSKLFIKIRQQTKKCRG